MRNKRTITCLTITFLNIIFLLCTWEYWEFPIIIHNNNRIFASNLNKNEISKLISLIKNVENSEDENGEEKHVKPKLEELPDIVGLSDISYCDSLEKSDILVVIPSQAKNFEKRNFIRSTWGNSRVFSRVLFFVAIPNKLMTAIKLFEEAMQHGDLLLINTPDSYQHLNIRVIAILKWVQSNCHRGFIMKIDDDMLVNPDSFVTTGLLDILDEHVDKKVAFGRVHRNTNPHRSGKWAISKSEWPDDVWPDFTLGFCYILTQPALRAIINAYTRSSWFIWLEDVYITGILLSEGGGEVRQVFTYYTEEKPGSYMDNFSPVINVVEKFRNDTTGIVNLDPVQNQIGNVSFIHMKDYMGPLRDFVYSHVWGMDKSKQVLDMVFSE